MGTKYIFASGRMKTKTFEPINYFQYYLYSTLFITSTMDA